MVETGLAFRLVKLIPLISYREKSGPYDKQGLSFLIKSKLVNLTGTNEIVRWFALQT